LTQDGDSFRIAAEAIDVVTHPFNGCSLIEETDVLGQPRGAGKAKDVETVAVDGQLSIQRCPRRNCLLDGHIDDVLSGGNVLALVKLGIRAAKNKSYKVKSA